MDSNEEIQLVEEEPISPIIRIFEQLTFERGHEVHDQISSMIELFSLSEITLDMLDTLIECIKIVFVHPHTSKNMRLLDFIVTLTHVTHTNYSSNRNLSLVFDALIDIFSQTMAAADSQIRYTALNVLNRLQTFVDLSRSPIVPDQLEQYLLDLLNNETTLLVLDQVIPLAATFQHRNPQFIEAFLRRLQSPKWHSYKNRRRQVVSLLQYSPSCCKFLLSAIEDDDDLSRLAFESLLSQERGFTPDRLDSYTRSTIFLVASKSRELSRLMFSQWISQSGYELIDLLRLCKLPSTNDTKSAENIQAIETCLRHFLDDSNIRRIVIHNTKLVIGTSSGGVLLPNVSDYVEYLFIWRLLCQVTSEEDDEINIHPDFHEFITYFYRLIKSSVNRALSSSEEFIITQYGCILATFDLFDIYRRKCTEAIGRCILVHYGQYQRIVEQAFRLIHSSVDTLNERCKLMTYILNDLIQRCQSTKNEELTFIQCMTIIRVFLEQEQQVELSNTDLKHLIDSLIKSGLKHKHIDIQSQTLATLKSLVCHSRHVAVEYVEETLRIINKVEHIPLKRQAISIFIDVLFTHGAEIMAHLNASNLALSQLIEQYILGLFQDKNMEIRNTVTFGLMKLLLSSRVQPTVELLKLILDYRFSNDFRSMSERQRDDIDAFFYFFIHSSNLNVLLMEELTFDLISRCLPLIPDNSTIAYRSILTESMCYFCVELLSLPTLPVDKLNEEHSHYRLAKNLLASIHSSVNNRSLFIVKCYLNIIKRFQFQYMHREQLQTIFDSILQLRQYSNLPSTVSATIKHIEQEIQSCLKLIGKLTHDQPGEKRSRSPSPSSQRTSKRISSTFQPTLTSSPNILRDRTNSAAIDDEKATLSKGLKRKSNAHRYLSLDFENDADDCF